MIMIFLFHVKTSEHTPVLVVVVVFGCFHYLAGGLALPMRCCAPQAICHFGLGQVVVVVVVP